MPHKSEETMRLAINAVHSKEYASLRRTAEVYGVSRSTLSRRVLGLSKSRFEAHEEQQLLSMPEESAVVDACKSLAAMGFPIPSHWHPHYTIQITVMARYMV